MTRRTLLAVIVVQDLCLLWLAAVLVFMALVVATHMNDFWGWG